MFYFGIAVLIGCAASAMYLLILGIAAVLDVNGPYWGALILIGAAVNFLFACGLLDRRERQRRQ